MQNLAVNTTSAFAAAQQAAISFGELPDSAARTFIFTGNCTNVAPIASLLDASAGKAATATIIQVAAEAYASKGYKFVVSYLVVLNDFTDYVIQILLC